MPVGLALRLLSVCLLALHFAAQMASGPAPPKRRRGRQHSKQQQPEPERSAKPSSMRVTRSVTRLMRRSIPPPTFSSTFLQQPQLLGQLLRLLPADDVSALCEASEVCRAGAKALLDQPMWTRFLVRHCHVDWNAGGILAALNTMPLRLRFACYELVNYLNLRRQLECFRDCVVVVRGDLGLIQRVDGQKVDCLVFPTAATYRDPGVGVATRVHERAGPALDRAVRNVRLQGYAPAGSVMSTVGCESGVQLLVHCVGPFVNTRDADKLLYKTYVDALWAIEHNEVACAAVASVSTGRRGFSYQDAAPIALAAVRDMIRCKPHWRAKIVFVCYEGDAFKEFERARCSALLRLHTDDFPFPEVLTPTSAADGGHDSA